MAIFIFTVDMLHSNTLFFSFDEKSRVHMHYAAMRQSTSIKIPFFVWSLRFLHTDILHKLTRKKRGGGRSLRSISEFPYLIVTAALIFISLVEYK